MNNVVDKRLDESMKPGTTLMAGIRSSADLSFRPLTVARAHEATIEILLDTSEPWTNDLVHGDPIYVTLSDTREKTWTRIDGTMSTTTETTVIDELWNPFADAYVAEGRNTPGMTVLRIEASRGRYWSTPSGRLGSLVSVIKAKRGTPEDAGIQGKVQLDQTQTPGPRDAVMRP